MFPVLSREEMRGFTGNELAAISDNQEQQIWAGIMARLGAIPEHRRMFQAAYPGQRFEQMTFAHASNAIAGFIIDRLSFNNSPWDRFLAGNDAAMTQVQLQGAKDFMTARCSVCHNGAALTDNKFHNVAVPQLGPGKGDGGGRDDFGRMRETGDAADKYAFRTPALRNVELTVPYGHDGAFVSLRDFVDHYSESATKLMNYNPAQLEPSLRSTVLDNKTSILSTRDRLLSGVVFSPQVVDEVTEFMKALTDPAARNLQGVVPGRVPSGLSIDGGIGPR
jgi:cytochrome c peroxidase